MKLNFVLGRIERTIIIDIENSERFFDDQNLHRFV